MHAWSHAGLTLVHSKRSALATPEFKVFIDGVLRDKTPIRFATGVSTADVTIGAGARSRSAGADTTHSLRAQLASVYLMHPLNDTTAVNLAALGT
jgi:hypothetical protein